MDGIVIRPRYPVRTGAESRDRARRAFLPGLASGWVSRRGSQTADDDRRDHGCHGDPQCEHAARRERPRRPADRATSSIRPRGRCTRRRARPADGCRRAPGTRRASWRRGQAVRQAPSRAPRRPVPDATGPPARVRPRVRDRGRRSPTRHRRPDPDHSRRGPSTAFHRRSRRAAGSSRCAPHRPTGAAQQQRHDGAGDQATDDGQTELETTERRIEERQRPGPERLGHQQRVADAAADDRARHGADHDVEEVVGTQPVRSARIPAVARQTTTTRASASVCQRTVRLEPRWTRGSKSNAMRAIGTVAAVYPRAEVSACRHKRLSPTRCPSGVARDTHRRSSCRRARGRSGVR